MEKVLALVVTYNRQGLLAGCIDALRNQTRPVDDILVVNNGSTDNTSAWLKAQADLQIVNQENTGSAGGFSTGIKWAFDHGYTWVWCMDDDGYSKEDALENLLKAEDGTLRLLNCAVLNIEDKKSIVWKTKEFKTGEELKDKFVDDVAHPFNGTLIHRRIIERVGIPDTRYFLWGDETQYLHRITKINAIPCRTVGNAVHYHPATRFSIKQDWVHASSWKMYFYVRNRHGVLQAKYNNKLLGSVGFVCFLVAYASIICLFQKTHKLKKLKFMFLPVKHIIQNKLTMTPAMILKELNKPSSRKGVIQPGSISDAVKNLYQYPATSQR